MRRVPFTLLVSILLPIPILCIAPVHPDAPDHHTLQTQHSRNQYKVQPELLHPAFCKGITNERCLQWDTEMKANARNLQYVIKTNGFVRVLVLLMKFTDHIDKESPPIEEYNLLFNDPGQTPLITPSGSISSWFHANSYGTFNIEAEIVPWHVTDNTEKYYADGKSGISHDFRFSMYPILDQLEAEGFDFSPFDLNNDGLIDSIGTSPKNCPRIAFQFQKVTYTNTTSRHDYLTPKSCYIRDTPQKLEEKTALLMQQLSIGSGLMRSLLVAMISGHHRMDPFEPMDTSWDRHILAPVNLP